MLDFLFLFVKKLIVTFYFKLLHSCIVLDYN